jgi:hypothetical protein
MDGRAAAPYGRVVHAVTTGRADGGLRRAAPPAGSIGRDLEVLRLAHRERRLTAAVRSLTALADASVAIRGTVAPHLVHALAGFREELRDVRAARAAIEADAAPARAAA